MENTEKEVIFIPEEDIEEDPIKYDIESGVPTDYFDECWKETLKFQEEAEMYPALISQILEATTSDK